MGVYYYGKLMSIEETKSLHFSLRSNFSCLHVRVTDIVLCLSPQLHQSSIVLHNSTQRCSSNSPPCWAENFLRVGEFILNIWKSCSICLRNSACFLWNSASLRLTEWQYQCISRHFSFSFLIHAATPFLVPVMHPS